MANFTPTFDNPQQTEWAPGTSLAPPPPPTAPAPGDAPPSLAGDPTYLAFQRALGLQKSNAERTTQQQVDSLNQQLPGQVDWLGRNNDLAKKQIAGSMEARGILRSSETNTNLANQDASYGHAVSDLQDSTANRIAALRQALATQEAGYAGQDITAQQDSADRQELARQQAAIQQQLLDALNRGTVLPDLSQLIPGLKGTP